MKSGNITACNRVKLVGDRMFAFSEVSLTTVKDTLEVTANELYLSVLGERLNRHSEKSGGGKLNIAHLITYLPLSYFNDLEHCFLPCYSSALIKDNDNSYKGRSFHITLSLRMKFNTIFYFILLRLNLALNIKIEITSFLKKINSPRITVKTRLEENTFFEVWKNRLLNCRFTLIGLKVSS